MRMRKISAPTMEEALATARRELGDDAVLLESKRSSQGKGVVVTFAIESEEDPLFEHDIAATAEVLPFRDPITKPYTTRVEMEHPAIALITQAFEYHGLPLALAERTLSALYKVRLIPDSVIEVAQNALADAFTSTLPFQPISTKTLSKRALMFVGTHGAGKTSSIAKLATELTLAKQPVVLVTTDLERMGGADTLQQLADLLKCDFYLCEKRQQLKLLLKRYLGNAWVLIDSAGANIYEFSQMKHLGEFATLQGVEPLLVCPAGADADETAEMASVFDFLSIERMLITRLDAARRLKGVFSAMTSGGYALSNFTQSALPTDACQPITPIALSRLMLRHAREKLSQ